MCNVRSFYVALVASLAAVTMAAAPASAQQQKPNILVIMGDDIGYWNISAYNRGNVRLGDC
jgi:ABC-type sugar transport system substrate-binding protein